MGMLVTRPNHDLTTTYLFFWSELLIKQAKIGNEPVIDLAGKKANIKEFTSVIKKKHPGLIVINGHGNDDIVTGYDNEPLIQAGKNQTLLKNAVVFARSCRSAKILGPVSVDSGCIAYIGYDDDFVFVTEKGKLSSPLEDKTAQLFLEPSNHVVISLLKKQTPQDANNRSKKLFKQNIQKLTTSAATKEDKQLIPYLVWDYIHQVCLEEKSKRK